jgi:hypothetical protein
MTEERRAARQNAGLASYLSFIVPGTGSYPP